MPNPILSRIVAAIAALSTTLVLFSAVVGIAAEDRARLAAAQSSKVVVADHRASAEVK
ncbi:MAG: hypothetical protein HXY24_17435 [Rubrivivax sp.]|nr:hypothetical protein [Rubrivivax sp.]